MLLLLEEEEEGRPREEEEEEEEEGPTPVIQIRAQNSQTTLEHSSSFSSSSSSSVGPALFLSGKEEEAPPLPSPDLLSPKTMLVVARGHRKSPQLLAFCGEEFSAKIIMSR